MVGFSRYMVFYLIRLTVATLGMFGLFYFATAVKKKFGRRVSDYTLLLAVFNHYVLFIMNRVNMDSIMAILNLYIFAFWLERKVKLIVVLGVFTVLLRLNFLPILGIILLHFLFFSQNSSFLGTLKKIQRLIKDRFKKLLLWGITTSVVWLSLFFIIDSWWYQKPTLSFYNFLHFNIVK